MEDSWRRRWLLPDVADENSQYELTQKAGAKKVVVAGRD